MRRLADRLSSALPSRIGGGGALGLPRPSRLDVWLLGLGMSFAALVGLFAAAGVWIVGFVLILLALFAVTVLANPERVALTLLVLLPFMIYPIAVGGFSVFVAIPLFGFTSLALLLRQRGATRVVARTLPARWFAVLLVIAIYTSALSVDPLTAFTRTSYLVLFGLFAWALGTTLVTGRITRDTLVRTIVIAGALSGAAVLAQFAAQFVIGRGATLDFMFNGLSWLAGESGGFRNWTLDSPDVVRGIFPFMTPPSAGQFLMIALIAGAWLLRERRRAGAGMIGVDAVMVLIIALALLSTFSRQSWIGAAVGVIALGFLKRPLWMLTAITAAVLVIVFVPTPGGGGTFADFLFEAADTSSRSTAGRLAFWEQAIGYIPDTAFLGTGPGLYGSLQFDPLNAVRYAHNVYLDAAVELGIAGAVAVIALLILGMRAALRRGHMLPFACLLAFAVVSFFDDAFFFPRNGLLIAAVFALIMAPREKDRESRPQPGEVRSRPRRPYPPVGADEAATARPLAGVR